MPRKEKEMGSPTWNESKTGTAFGMYRVPQRI